MVCDSLYILIYERSYQNKLASAAAIAGGIEKLPTRTLAGNKEGNVSAKIALSLARAIACDCYLVLSSSRCLLEPYGGLPSFGIASLGSL